MKNSCDNSEGTCFKPLSELEKIISETSAGDMLLFMIAQDRRDKKDELENKNTK